MHRNTKGEFISQREAQWRATVRVGVVIIGILIGFIVYQTYIINTLLDIII